MNITFKLRNICVLCFPSGKAFNYLDAPVVRVTSADIPMPYARLLEQNAMPQVFNVTESVKRVLNVSQSASAKS